MIILATMLERASPHGSRNRHNNNNFERVTVDSSSNENDHNNNNFEDSKIVSSWNENRNNDHNNNNNNFGEAMTDNINDFTHEIINGVNDMIRIHTR